MSQRAISIHIAQPGESWAAMMPASGGRHCAACQKTVVDFSRKTDAEILTYFRQPGSGKTCGRFRREQLARPLATAALPAPAARWQLWLAGLLVATLTMQSCQTTTGEPLLTTQSPPQAADSSRAAPAAADTAAALIRGKVLDATSRRPIAGAIVTLSNTSLRTTTDAAGYFALPESEQVDLSQALTLEMRAPGYPLCSQVVFPTPPAPAGGLLAVLTTLPLPTTVLGEVAALPR